MARYEIIVTDVTCYGTLFCVAGWDIVAGRMIRPEPPGANAAAEASRFWDNRFAGPGTSFAVGNLVRFEANPPPQNFPFPHATEDRMFVGGTPIEVVRALTLPQTAAAVAAGVSLTVGAAFDGALVMPASGKAYMPKDQRARSLGAVEIRPGQVRFFENTYDPARPRLRAMVTSDGRSYDLSVTAAAARTRWQANGLAALQADAAGSNRLHVRLGLSRPFSAMPDQCYVQMNGVYFL